MMFDKNGRQIADNDQRKTVPDGGYLRVRMNVMDAQSQTVDEIVQDTIAPRVPVGTRTLPMSDSDRERREQMFEQRDERLGNAWKQPASVAAPAQQEVQTETVIDSDPYAARNARLSNRWRNAS